MYELWCGVGWNFDVEIGVCYCGYYFVGDCEWWWSVRYKSVEISCRLFDIVVGDIFWDW